MRDVCQSKKLYPVPSLSLPCLSLVLRCPIHWLKRGHGSFPCERNLEVLFTEQNASLVYLDEVLYRYRPRFQVLASLIWKRGALLWNRHAFRNKCSGDKEVYAKVQDCCLLPILNSFFCLRLLLNLIGNFLLRQVFLILDSYPVINLKHEMDHF